MLTNRKWYSLGYGEEPDTGDCSGDDYGIQFDDYEEDYIAAEIYYGNGNNDSF